MKKFIEINSTLIVSTEMIISVSIQKDQNYRIVVNCKGGSYFSEYHTKKDRDAAFSKLKLELLG